MIQIGYFSHSLTLHSAWCTFTIHRKKLQLTSQLSKFPRNVLTSPFPAVADPKILKRGAEDNLIYQLHRHLSQMRTRKYMAFTRKNAAFCQKCEPIGVGGRPHRPPFLNPPLLPRDLLYAFRTYSSEWTTTPCSLIQPRRMKCIYY